MHDFQKRLKNLHTLFFMGEMGEGIKKQKLVTFSLILVMGVSLSLCTDVEVKGIYVN